MSVVLPYLSLVIPKNFIVFCVRRERQNEKNIDADKFFIQHFTQHLLNTAHCGVQYLVTAV